MVSYMATCLAVFDPKIPCKTLHVVEEKGEQSEGKKKSDTERKGETISYDKFLLIFGAYLKALFFLETVEFIEYKWIEKF